MDFDCDKCTKCHELFSTNGDWEKCQCGDIYCDICKDDLIRWGCEAEDVFFCKTCDPYNPHPSDKELCDFMLKNEKLKEMVTKTMNKKQRRTPICGDCKDSDCNYLHGQYKGDLKGYCCKCVGFNLCEKCEKNKKC